MNKKGIVLISSFMFIGVLTILGAALILRSVSESRIAQSYAENTQAFWLAEAGINKALYELRGTYDTSSGLCKWSASLGRGRYCVDLGDVDVSGQNRLVIAHGCIPDVSCSSATRERKIEAVIHKFQQVPPNFYNNAIYVPGNVDITSLNEKHNIDGDLRYGGTINPAHPPDEDFTTGHQAIDDSSLNILPRLDFEQLRTISKSQIVNGRSNYRDAAHIDDPLPESFWYNEAAGIPNVVFLEGSLNKSGNKTIGGFVVVGGETVFDVELGGNIQIIGAIYTLGNFTLRGGGNALNVDGGVWAGQQVTLTGNAKLKYDPLYMSKIEALGINVSAQVSSWKDMQGPYEVTP